MARLIAVYVSAHQALFGDVFVMLIVLLRQMHGEELVQFPYECLFPSHQINHTEHIVRHVEGEIP